MDGKLLLMDTAPAVIRRKREALSLEKDGINTKKLRTDDSAYRGL
jgi:hypothetical protein